MYHLPQVIIITRKPAPQGIAQGKQRCNVVRLALAVVLGFIFYIKQFLFEEIRMGSEINYVSLLNDVAGAYIIF